VRDILSAASIARAPVEQATLPTSPATLRRVKRLTWFALLGVLSIIGGTQIVDDLPRHVSIELALGIIVVASWAIVAQVACYMRSEDARRAAESEVARLEGARSTASAMQDRIANKLSLTVGYSEFLVTDPRLPDDLREQAQKAMDGALAAAEFMSELKRLTRLDHERACNGRLVDAGDQLNRFSTGRERSLHGVRMGARLTSAPHRQEDRNGSRETVHPRG
jgi:hypothetical protein